MRINGFKKGDTITANFGWGTQSKDVEDFFNKGYRITSQSFR